MSAPTLIDTSVWIEALRDDGDVAVRAMVEQFLSDDTALFCDPVRLELWNGARDDKQRKHLKEMETVLPRLEISGRVWNLACEYAVKARGKGFTVPANDLLIFACAKHYGVELEHKDRHYDLLATLP